MKKTIALAFVLSTSIAFAQINKKEYYDFQKTKIMADYQVNAAGEKNGWFKGYDKQGILVYEYNYKNGQWNGLNKEYTTYSGKREIMKSETYKDGLLDGPATYYGENGLVLKQGSYKNDKKDGKWTFLEPYNNYNVKDPSELKGCEYIKSEAVYTDGEPAMNGKVTLFFYPSGKVRSEQEYANGKKVGEEKWFFPNGKLEAYYKYDGTTGNYLLKKTYYANGQLWEFADWTSGEMVLEDYYEDGSPGKSTLLGMGEKKKTRATIKADSALRAGNQNLCISVYKEAGINTEVLESIIDIENKFNSGSLDPNQASREFDKIQLYRANEQQKKYYAERKDVLNKKVNELTQLNETLKSKWKTYTEAYTEPINNFTAYAYPKGEFIYFRSRAIIDDLYATYNKAVTPEDKLKAGPPIIAACDKMIAHSTSEQCKDLNKQLKKVEDKAQIKTILGL